MVSSSNPVSIVKYKVGKWVHTLQTTLLSADNNGLQELVTILGTLLSVDVLDGLDRIISGGALAEDDALESAINSQRTYSRVLCNEHTSQHAPSAYHGPWRSSGQRQ